jgi:hypothetical protein
MAPVHGERDRQGVLSFAFEVSPRPMDLTARAGLSLVAEAVLALGLDDVVRGRVRLLKRRRGLDDFEKLLVVVLMLAAGGECVEDVEILRRDLGLQRLLGRELPSADALHRFLGAFHDERELAQRPKDGAWIPTEPTALRQLAQVNVELVRRAVALRKPRRATLDLDATILESHKREALAHFKGGRGYQPTAVVWAEEDLVVADEYRDGNVPAGMQTREVAQRGFAALPVDVVERYFRGDSACYDVKLLKYLWREKIAFTISADMTKELRRVCAARGVRWTMFEKRESEWVETAEVEFTPGDWPKDAPPMRYVALRFTGQQGRLFDDGTDTKYLAVVSNRSECAPKELVRWHWEKAGTIEFVHDVTKNELGVRVPPSGRFGANAAWYRLGLITYNVLTVLRRIALPERLQRARPERLRYEIFTVPAEIRTHARQLRARLGVPELTADELILARRRLLAFQDQLRQQLSTAQP